MVQLVMRVSMVMISEADARAMAAAIAVVVAVHMVVVVVLIVIMGNLVQVPVRVDLQVVSHIISLPTWVGRYVVVMA
jgi:hypothetical protein